MKNELTQEEIERRFAQIEARGIEAPTPEELAAIEAAEAMDDGTTEEYKAYLKGLEDYSGKLVLRIPRSLHKSLKEEAALEGVSLNQYMLYKLAR